MEHKNFSAKIEAAYRLLSKDAASREKFEDIKTLIKGLSPQIDKHLANISKGIDLYEKINKVEIIDLTVENLPEQTEEQKKRKKALLLLFRSWNELKSEVMRVAKELNVELDSEKSNLETQKPGAQNFARIFYGAKGKFGIITIAALLMIVGFMLLKSGDQIQNPNSNKINKNSPNTIEVIEFEGKYIPISELHESTGPECDGDTHYHANNGFVIAVDGQKVEDVNSCGFGKTKDANIIRIEKSTK